MHIGYWDYLIYVVPLLIRWLRLITSDEGFKRISMEVEKNQKIKLNCWIKLNRTKKTEPLLTVLEVQFSLVQNNLVWNSSVWFETIQF